MQNDKIETIRWLKSIRKTMHDTPGSLFNASSNLYVPFWTDYCNISERLEEAGLPPIDLPGEMDYPHYFDHQIERLTDNYTEWYKKNFKEFCQKMKETEKVLDKYIIENETRLL